MQQLQSALPGVGGSSKKRSKGGTLGSIPVVGGALSSLGGKSKGAGKRGRKPAMLGLIGAGAAGVAAIAKKRRSGGIDEYATPGGGEFSAPAKPAATPPAASSDKDRDGDSKLAAEQEKKDEPQAE